MNTPKLSAELQRIAEETSDALHEGRALTEEQLEVLLRMMGDVLRGDLSLRTRTKLLELCECLAVESLVKALAKAPS